MGSSRFPFALASLLALLVGCATPTTHLAKPEALQQGILGFLQDNRSTREEILLQLGTPMAQFEGERILTYAFMPNAKGEWQRVGRWAMNNRGRHEYGPGTCSLVLVFDAKGVLAKHSLVVAQ